MNSPITGILKPFPIMRLSFQQGTRCLQGLGTSRGKSCPVSLHSSLLPPGSTSLAQVSVVLAHGRDHAEASGKSSWRLSRGKVVFLVPDPGFRYPGLAGALALLPGYGHSKSSSVEDLGYPGEKILIGSPANPPHPVFVFFPSLSGIYEEHAILCCYDISLCIRKPPAPGKKAACSAFPRNSENRNILHAAFSLREQTLSYRKLPVSM